MHECWISPIPSARRFDELEPNERPGEAESLVMIPLVLDKGRHVKASISLDAGLLEAIDEEAKRRGLTRSAFLVGAAIDKIEGAGLPQAPASHAGGFAERDAKPLGGRRKAKRR
jgi:Ribbon-helix-helix protein, copG family